MISLILFNRKRKQKKSDKKGIKNQTMSGSEFVCISCGGKIILQSDFAICINCGQHYSN